MKNSSLTGNRCSRSKRSRTLIQKMCWIVPLNRCKLYYCCERNVVSDSFLNKFTDVFDHEQIEVDAVFSVYLVYVLLVFESSVCPSLLFYFLSNFRYKFSGLAALREKLL